MLQRATAFLRAFWGKIRPVLKPRGFKEGDQVQVVAIASSWKGWVGEIVAVQQRDDGTPIYWVIFPGIPAQFRFPQMFRDDELERMAGGPVVA